MLEGGGLAFLDALFDEPGDGSGMFVLDLGKELFEQLD